MQSKCPINIRKACLPQLELHAPSVTFHVEPNTLVNWRSLSPIIFTFGTKRLRFSICLPFTVNCRHLCQSLAPIHLSWIAQICHCESANNLCSKNCCFQENRCCFDCCCVSAKSTRAFPSHLFCAFFADNASLFPQCDEDDFWKAAKNGNPRLHSSHLLFNNIKHGFYGLIDTMKWFV